MARFKLVNILEGSYPDLVSQDSSGGIQPRAAAREEQNTQSQTLPDRWASLTASLVGRSVQDFSEDEWNSVCEIIDQASIDQNEVLEAEARLHLCYWLIDKLSEADKLTDVATREEITKHLQRSLPILGRLKNVDLARTPCSSRAIDPSPARS